MLVQDKVELDGEAVCIGEAVCNDEDAKLVEDEQFKLVEGEK